MPLTIHLPHPCPPQRPALVTRMLLLPALAAVGLGALLALAAPAEAQARTRHRAEHNADGSATARTGVARIGPNGALLRGRTATTDGQGNASVTSRGAAVGAQGGVAVRQGSTTRHADRSARHSASQ